MYFTDEFGRYFKNSPTDLPTELIRRHLTVSCHQYRRIYRRIYSVGISYTHRRIYRRIDSSVNHNITDGIKIRRYISSGNLFFFGTQIPSVKPSANGFFVLPTDIATERGITDEDKADGRNPSVMTSVKKSPTNF